VSTRRTVRIRERAAEGLANTAVAIAHYVSLPSSRKWREQLSKLTSSAGCLDDVGKLTESFSPSTVTLSTYIASATPRKIVSLSTKSDR
jgi:hypothetical protein